MIWTIEYPLHNERTAFPTKISHFCASKRPHRFLSTLFMCFIRLQNSNPVANSRSSMVIICLFSFFFPFSFLFFILVHPLTVGFKLFLPRLWCRTASIFLFLLLLLLLLLHVQPTNLKSFIYVYLLIFLFVLFCLFFSVVCSFSWMLSGSLAWGYV